MFENVDLNNFFIFKRICINVKKINILIGKKLLVRKNTMRQLNILSRHSNCITTIMMCLLIFKYVFCT